MRVRSVVAIVLVAGVAACSSTPMDPPTTPVSLAVVTEPSVSAQSGVALAVQPVVELRDAKGAVVTTRGVLVTAAMATGGGALVGTTEVRTDASGQARFTDLGLAGPVGTKSLRFTAAGLAAATSGSIELGPGAATVLAPQAGNNQTATAGTALPVAPAALVTDGSNNPVQGVAVSFAVTAGGGTVDGGTATSGADGIARVTKWTLGTKAGPNTLSASAGGLQASFTATATVGPPAKIAIVSGDAQSAVIGNPVAVAPSVKVTDQFDNPVSGIAVTFAPSGGGSVVGGTQSDVNGVASVSAWNLGLTPGAQTLAASRTGVLTVTLTATALDFQVQTVAAGSLTSCGLSSAGLAYCWGDNSLGQLGDGTLVGKSLPVAVQGGRVYTKIGVGSGHACALASTGDVYCWGSNSAGQLGSNNTNLGPSPTPELVAAGNLRFKALAVGDIHSCALDQAGAAWCWGSNGNGRLGVSAGFGFAIAPDSVSTTDVFTAITAGAAHTCALRTDGQVLCWGSNNGGRLGDGTGIDQATPVLVLLASTNFTAVAGGGVHTCGITAAQTAYCWGVGANGALGNGATANQLTPVLVSGTDTWSGVGLGAAHSCGITTTGQVKCWGSNGSGRLGDGTLISRTVPTAVLGTFTATVIEPGFDQTCARTAAGSAICWGADASGQLGDGGTLAAPRPTGVHQP